MPKTRQEFWEAKFESNVTRDQRVAKQLKLNGWKVLVIWECEIRGGSFKKINFRRLFTEASDV